MDITKVEKLKLAGDTSVTAAEIAEMHEKMAKTKAAGNCLCIDICEWIIKKAVGTGSCAAGEAALTGIFTLAEAVFFPEGEPILVPLEVVVDAAWGVVCAEIGIAVLGDEAAKYAEEWCKEAKLC